MKKDDLSNLCSLLEQKLSTFKDFLSATELLKEAAVSEDMQHIETLTGKRQGCIRKIDQIDCRIKDIKACVNSSRPSRTKKRAELLSTDIINIAENAACLNREFETILDSRRGEMRTRISETRRRQTGVRGYVGGVERRNQPRFLDIRS